LKNLFKRALRQEKSLIVLQKSGLFMAAGKVFRSPNSFYIRDASAF